MKTTEEISTTAQLWDEAFAKFEREHPNAAEGMRVMNITFPEYLKALAAIRQVPTNSASSDTLYRES